MANETTKTKKKKSTVEAEEILVETQKIEEPIKKLPVHRRDFEQIIFIPPEMDKELIKKKLEELGYHAEDTSYSFLLSISIPQVMNDDRLIEYQKLQELLKRIKMLQMNFYDQNREKLPYPVELTRLVSKYIVEVNNKAKNKLTKESLFLILQNILKDLYVRDIEGIKFLDDEEIEHMANAAVSTVLSEAENNLKEALIEILVKIRKMLLVWIYDVLSILTINFLTDDPSIIEQNDYVIIDDVRYKVFSISLKGEKFYFAIDLDNPGNIATFNLGKRRKEILNPILYYLLVDQIAFKIKKEYFEIVIEAMKRVMNETLNQLQNLEIEYEKYTSEELEQIRSGIIESIEYLYRMIVNSVHESRAQNKDYKNYYRNEYGRILMRAIQGAIPQRVLELTPITTIEKLDELVDQLEHLGITFKDLMMEVNNKLANLIKARKDNDKTLFNRLYAEFKDWSTTIIAKFFSELSK